MNLLPPPTSWNTVRVCSLVLTILCSVRASVADEALVKMHCTKCHSGAEPKGEFSIRDLGKHPTKENVDLWTASLDRVKAGEMPPAKKSPVSSADRRRMVQFLADQVQHYAEQSEHFYRIPPRRLNNREFENSVREVLLIEDVGTHQPVS